MCEDTQYIERVERMTNELQNTPLALSEKELGQTREAIHLYRQECNKCAMETGNDYKCMAQVHTNFTRRLPYNRKTIYPYVNYDWDYGNYISNHYSPQYTGATMGGSFQDLRKNTRAFVKLLNGLVDDPIPNSRSVPNTDHPESDHPEFQSCFSDYRCRATQQIRQGYKQEKPYSDNTGFMDKNLTGENSSSFYVQVGTCPKSKIRNQRDCEAKGYTWKQSKVSNNISAGSCEAPRYLFVDNTPKAFFNGSKMRGIIPSLANDFMGILPDKLFAALMGQSVTGQFAVQPCVEDFSGGMVNKNVESVERKWISFVWVFVAIILAVSVSLYIRK